MRITVEMGNEDPAKKKKKKKKMAMMAKTLLNEKRLNLIVVSLNIHLQVDLPWTVFCR